MRLLTSLFPGLDFIITQFEGSTVIDRRAASGQLGFAFEREFFLGFKAFIGPA